MEGLEHSMRTWLKNIIQYILIICCFVSGMSVCAANVEGIQEYQKNLHLSPEHKQKLAAAITRYHNADNLWDVLRDQFSLQHYEENYAVQAKIEWYMNNQDFLLRSASRAAPYLYYISQQVRKRHLPAELVLLPIVESGYNPYSVSNVGATGIWQLMPGTASGFGVKRDWWYDGRRDLIASTRAALTYLAYLQSFFEGNWLLAIAAYNTGEGNVLAAIKRNIRDGRGTDFWSLPLAQQTRDYVPSLLALAIIISNPDKYPVYFPPVRNAPYLARIDIGKQINLKHAAKLAGISHHKIMQLNSGYKTTTLSTKPSYKLVLPIENIEQFSENLARSFLSRASVNWRHYKVKSGDTLVSIARKFGTSVNDIRKMNHLSKHVVHRGTNLLIPRKAKSLDDEETETFDDENTVLAAENEERKQPSVIKKKIRKILDIVPVIRSAKHGYKLQPGDTIYMVRANDTLYAIANRFHVSVQALKDSNPDTTNKLKPGSQLFIPTHSKEEMASSEQTGTINPGDTIYMIRRGDTIERIARKFKTTPAAIRLANLLDDRSLIVGDSIVIPAKM